MRVTTNTLTNNYLKHLGTRAEDMNKARQKASTLRRYLSVEENPGLYVQEEKIKRDYAKNDDYQQAANKAQATLQNQDKILQSVIDIARNLSKKYSLEAVNDTSAAQREIYATELEKLQQSMVQALNSKDSGDFVFAGADGGKPPFELHNGNLYYRGLDVLTGRDKNGNLPGPDDKTLDTLNNEKLYYDMGFGLSTEPNTGAMPTGDKTGHYKIDESSAFNVSLSGLKAIGWADKDDSVSSVKGINNKYNTEVKRGDNIVSIAGALAKMLREFKDFNTEYKDFHTGMSGNLLYDNPVTNTREELKDALTNKPVRKGDVEVDKQGFLIDKETKNRIAKTAAGSPPTATSYWKASDAVTKSQNWHQEFSKKLKSFDAAFNRVLATETQVGVKMNFVEKTKSRLTLSQDILVDRYEEVAKESPEKAFTDWSNALMHYNTALRLGQSIIPKTLAEMLPF